MKSPNCKKGFKVVRIRRRDACEYGHRLHEDDKAPPMQSDIVGFLRRETEEETEIARGIFYESDGKLQFDGVMTIPTHSIVKKEILK